MKPLYYDPETGKAKVPPTCFNFDRDLAILEVARLERERDRAREELLVNADSIRVANSLIADLVRERDEARRVAMVLMESSLTTEFPKWDEIAIVKSWGEG